MKKQWRNLSVLVVIVIAAIGVYYFAPGLFAPANFESEFSGMSNIWVSYGLGSAGLHAQSEALLDLSDAQLGEMKGEISAFGSTAKLASTKALAVAYVKLIDASTAAQAANDSSRALVGEDLCAKAAEFEALNSLLGEQISKGEAYIQAMNAFVEDYPDEAALVGAYPADESGFDELRNGLSEQVALFDEAKGVC